MPHPTKLHVDPTELLPQQPSMVEHHHPTPEHHNRTLVAAKGALKAASVVVKASRADHAQPLVPDKMETRPRKSTGAERRAWMSPGAYQRNSGGLRRVWMSRDEEGPRRRGSKLRCRGCQRS